MRGKTFTLYLGLSLAIFGCNNKTKEKIIEVPVQKNLNETSEPKTEEIQKEEEPAKGEVTVEILNADDLASQAKDGRITFHFNAKSDGLSDYRLLCKAGKDNDVIKMEFAPCNGGNSHTLEGLEDRYAYVIVVKAVDASTGEDLGRENFSGFVYGGESDDQSGESDESAEGDESEGAGDIGEGVEIPVEGEVGYEPGEPRGPIVMPVGGVDILIPPHMYEQQFSTSHTMTGQLVVRQLEDDPFSWPFVCMQKHEYYRAYSFVDPYGLEHKRCELSLPYTDYLEFTNHTMARNHMIASTSPLAFQFPGRNARNEYIGYERVVVNVFEPGERPNPYDPALPESIVDTVDMFDYMCSGNSTQLIDTRFPGWMGIKQRGKVRVCKTDISAGLDHYGAAEVWVAQFLLPDLPVGYTDFCPSTAPCEEPVTTMEVIYVAQWDFAPTAGDFVIEAWDRVYDMIDVGGPSFPVPAHFEF